MLKPTENTRNLTWEGIPSIDVEKAIFVCGVNSWGGINMTKCEASAHYVETEVQCTRLSVGGALSCAATRTRETEGKPASNWTALNLAPFAYLMNFIRILPDIGTSDHVNERSTLELFLNNPATAIKDTADFPEAYDEIPMELFQARLSLVFNSFWQASTNATNFFGADGVALYQPVDARTYGNATGTWTQFTSPKYQVNSGWLSLYFAATAVTTVCSIITLVLRTQIRAPDIFGGVSALTRDSIFITSIPSAGSGIPEDDRARKLKNVWVRVQDVKPTDAVGRIAFSNFKEYRNNPGLIWERVYE